ncbi:tetratricopeptide repeat protein [Candidatus Protochlamydia sp. R18]|uniref:tetratricopeptide repeat protein n=1 Tax=Candidatus Protochlamydia sp. R18 TaxID=1353977 RepID=UPI0005AB019D|nr:tetratricopeptide repeat protein [Candidatus Protochlamydia sp. R18]
MNRDTTLINESLIDELMKQDDGVNLNSPFPIASQLEARRNYYAQIIELSWFKERIKTGIEVLIDENEDFMNVNSTEQIFGTTIPPSKVNHHAIFAIGKRHLETDHFQTSAAIFTVLAMLKPLIPTYWFCLGSSEQNCGNYERAIRSFKTAHDLDKNDLFSSLLEIECWLELGYDQEALLRFENIDKQLRDSSKLSANQAISLQALKQKLERKIQQMKNKKKLM